MAIAIYNNAMLNPLWLLLYINWIFIYRCN